MTSVKKFKIDTTRFKGEDYDDYLQRLEDESQDILQGNDYKYYVIQCGYTERLSKKVLKNMGAIYSQKYEDPNFKQDLIYIKHHINDNFIIKESVIFKDNYNIDSLMDIDHCACFDYQNFYEYIVYNDDIVVLYFDTESG
jgi:hypothetical protein